MTKPGQDSRREIDWHVMNNGGRYLVTDVVVDGVSMKITQRSEFAAIIQRNGGRPRGLAGGAAAATLGQGTYGSSGTRVADA